MRGALFQQARPPGAGPRVRAFFGPRLWKALRHDADIPWGWKDPRTTITFPIWLRVFPRARILHVLRNGVDVAISTHQRSLKQRSKLWKRLFPIDYCPATTNFEYCFHLWEEYVSFVSNHRHLVPETRFLEIRFEDLLRDPPESLRSIADFIGHPVGETVLHSACEQVNQRRLDNSLRARLYQDKIPDLALSPLMQKLNYRYRQ
jgi:hypothetical protein